MNRNYFISPLDVVITPLAYLLPVIILTVTAPAVLYKFLRHRNYTDGLVVTLSFLSLIMYYVALLFAYKGIENAIARYLYVYASSIYVLAVSQYLATSRIGPRLAPLLLLVTTLTVTESFFTPYASIFLTPDISRFKAYTTIWGLMELS